MQLQNQVVVVTGASEGIGREIALALAKRGATLALVARTEAKLESVLAKVTELGSPNSQIYLCDVQQLAEIKKTAAQIIDDFPHNLIGLVNNAGIWQKKADLENIPDDELTDVIEIDLMGLIRFTKELLPALKAQPESAIVNISSRSGITAQAGQSVYSAAKWGVKGFTEVLKEDLKDTSIHVAGVYQGGTNTKMFHKAGETWPEDKLTTFIPAAELGEVVAYLLSLPPQIWLSEIHVENQ